jgi:pilus assembly protein Flp/PilA
LMPKNNRKRKGQALLEYALLIAGVALMGMVAVTMLGHKTTQLIAAVATVIPAAHTEDNAPIFAGQLIETTQNASGDIVLDLNTIFTNSGTDRLANNLLGTTNAPTGFGGLVDG